MKAVLKVIIMLCLFCTLAIAGTYNDDPRLFLADDDDDDATESFSFSFPQEPEPESFGPSEEQKVRAAKAIGSGPRKKLPSATLVRHPSRFPSISMSF